MYSNFAQFYNSLTEDVCYKERADYISALFERFDRKPKILLDLACGTGGFSEEFAKKDISVIGVDISPEMLTEASESAKKSGLDILYLCQDACELDLYGTVDGAICCLDSLNHITDYEKFCIALEKVSLFLEKDRLFIFDVNTIFKHKYVLGDNTFVIETDDTYCVWQNEFCENSNSTFISLDFFARTEGETYERLTEDFCERAYSQEEIENALNRAGFKIEAVFEEMSNSAPDDQTQRAIYIARKIK